MRHVLHAYILEKPNRSTIVLNYDIAPRKEKYEQAYQFCQPYLRTLNPLPDNIQTINQQIAERFKKLLSQNATYFKDAEKNGYLHTRIETLLAYLKEQFPTHNKPAEKG